MQRNFRVIFNALLFIFILADIVYLIILGIDFALNLKPSILIYVRLEILVSVLILVQTLYKLNKDKERRQYLVKNWIDIFAIVPITYIAIFLFPTYKLIIIVAFLIRIYALTNYLIRLRDIIRFTEKTKLDVATFILLCTFIFGSILFFYIESPVNPEVANIDDSAFFMIVSMTTVGYGNIVPITGIGKMVSVIAIIVGVAYTGWVTAAIASSLIEELRKERKEEIEKQNESMENILEKLDKIEKELEKVKNSKKNK